MVVKYIKGSRKVTPENYAATTFEDEDSGRRYLDNINITTLKERFCTDDEEISLVGAGTQCLVFKKTKIGREPTIIKIINPRIGTEKSEKESLVKEATDGNVNNEENLATAIEHNCFDSKKRTNYTNKTETGHGELDVYVRPSKKRQDVYDRKIRHFKKELDISEELGKRKKQTSSNGGLEHIVATDETGEIEIDGINALYFKEDACGEMTLKRYIDLNADRYQKEDYQLKIAQYFKDVSVSLSTLSELGIVHSDLKPENMVITLDDKCKLIDWGCAERLNKEEISSNGKNIGAIQGSPQYMSPEQCGGCLNVKTDIYCLGRSLFFALGGGEKKIKKCHGDGELCDDQELNLFDVITIRQNGIDNLNYETIPYIWRSLVRECVQTDPEDRPSCDKIINELESIYQKLYKGNTAVENRIGEIKEEIMYRDVSDEIEYIVDSKKQYRAVVHDETQQRCTDTIETHKKKTLNITRNEENHPVINLM